MYYIVITDKTLEYLKDYHLPALKTEEEAAEYHNSEEGKKYMQLDPLYIKGVFSKKNKLYQDISAAVAWIGLGYNVPLNIYIMKSNTYFKIMDINALSCIHVKETDRIINLIEDANSKNIAIPKLNNPEKTYFDNKLINAELYFKKALENIKIGPDPICFHIDINSK